MKSRIFSVVGFMVAASGFAVMATEQQQLSDVQHSRDQLPGPASKPLKVLLFSIPAWGHINPLLAVAEELVLRGHEVTFCLGVDEGNRGRFEEKIRKHAKYWHFDSDVLLKMGENRNASFLKKAFVVAGSLFSDYAVNFMLLTNGSLSDGLYDIVLSNDFLVGVLKCIEYGYDVPVVLVGTLLQITPHHYPQWAWPGIAHGSSSDSLSFFQRMVSVFDKWLHPLLGSLIFMPPFKAGLEDFCSGVSLGELAFSSGISFPHIVPTVIGFEYGRTRFPLTEYVGPLLSRSPPPLSEEMGEWLAGKPDRSVVYVSMGSLFDLNVESGRAILEGVMKTNYSLLWSLKASNQWILEGLAVDSDRVFISEFTPQFSVLASRAIHSAILHGGFNGVNEALWNGVAVIGLPQTAEQAANIGRVVHNGLGIQLSDDSITGSAVADALAAVDAGDYSRNVRRLQRMFRFAGGVKRAADLVEYYVEVGYAHLVPSYVKYRWSWVQYYNADVYLVFVVLLGVVVMSFRAAVKWVCTKCCRRKEKND